MKLFSSGVLEKYGVELIGAKADVIDRAEDRLKFRDAMAEIGIESPKSAIAHNMAEARAPKPADWRDAAGIGHAPGIGPGSGTTAAAAEPVAPGALQFLEPGLGLCYARPVNDLIMGILTLPY